MFLAERAKDPRIGFVTVTGVEVTPDLRQARVFVSVLGSEAEREQTFEGLASIAGHIRPLVGRRLRLRHAPEITFRHDPTIERAARIEQLLSEVRDDEPPAGSSPAR